MNVFVLCTGRSGSVTFFKACKHINNYSCGHESNWSLVGRERLLYPENHIEVDNRLVWMLGRMDKRYGNEAFYVHLIRDEEKTAKSFNGRWVLGRGSIIKAYTESILIRNKKTIVECLDYCQTVNANIELFLKDKTKKMTIRLKDVKEQFPEFWNGIGAKGDLDQALAEFDIQHNPSIHPARFFLNHQLWRLKRLFQ